MSTARVTLVARLPTIWARVGGPALTLALAVGIELLTGTPLRVPNPPAFLVLAIVFAAFNGGLGPGLVSAAIAWAYVAYFFSLAGQPFQYNDDNLRRVIVWALTMPLMAVMVGRLNQRAARALAEVKVAALRQEQLEARARAEEALHQAHQDYVNLVNSIDGIVWEADARTFAFNFVSRQTERLLGYPVERWLTEPTFWKEHIHPDDQDWAVNFCVNSTRDKRPHDFEYRMLAADGRVVWLRDIVTVVVENDQPVRLRGIMVDITERQRAEEARRESEALYRLITDSSTDLIGLMDFQGGVVFVSPSVQPLMGRTPAQVAGTNVFSFIHPEDAPASRAAWARALAGETATFAHRAQHADGGWRWLDGWGRKVQFQGQPRMLTVSRDITERKRAEEIAAQRLAELEALNRISTTLRTAPTLNAMLPVLLDETLAALDSAAGVIWLYHPENDELRVAVARGWFEQLQESPMKPGEGIAGTVFASGQAHRSREFVGDSLVCPSAVELIPAGWGGICVPIRAAAEVAGALFISVPLPREITPEETKLLVSLTEIAGTAVHRLRLHEETVRRLEHLQALQTVDRAITASLDSRIVLNTILAQVTAQLQVDAAGVLLFNVHAQTLEYAAGRGFRTRAYERSRLRLGECLAGRAAFEQRLIQAVTVLDRPDFVRAALLRDEAFVSYVAMPFIAKGQLKGVLEIFHRQPLQPDAEWLDFLETLAGQAAIAVDNLQLFDNLQRSNGELRLAYDTTIEGWSRALDLRDKETEGHTRRVTDMTLRMARAAGIPEPDLVHVQRGALLHDIGKMGIPDAILLKPDKLTDEEWAIMRQHPAHAHELLSPIAYLRPALDIPYCHHEKWDGSGYPRGLKGEQIPPAARLFAVVDVWDALRSDRPHRPGWPEDKVRDHIRAHAGTQFDPWAVELFFRVLHEVTVTPGS